MKYFRIKNWEKYQHRDHHKSMPWIKMYTSVFEDVTIFNLQTYQFGIWVKLMLLAARTENRVSADQRYLKSKLNIRRPVDLAFFESIGLIEFFDRVEDALRPRLEEKRGEEKRGEETTAPATRWKTPTEKKSVEQKPDEIWIDLLRHRKSHGRNVAPGFLKSDAKEAFSLAGGYKKLCDGDDKDIHYMKTDFINNLRTIRSPVQREVNFE